jgi:hypothetical protein
MLELVHVNPNPERRDDRPSLEVIQGGKRKATPLQAEGYLSRGLEILNKMNTLSKEEFVVWSLSQSKKEREEPNVDPDPAA